MQRGRKIKLMIIPKMINIPKTKKMLKMKIAI
jgi:hypothetical protein